MNGYVVFEQQYKVECRLGLHMRNSAKVVELHKKYATDGKIKIEGRRPVQMSSIISLLVAAILYGTSITVEANVKEGNVEQFHKELSDLFSDPHA
jgi:phosphotransferase system HPr (HPr) family protein